MDNKTVDINELKHVFLKRKRIMIICVLVCTLVSSIFAIRVMKPSYEARVKIFAGKNEEMASYYSKDELSNYQSLIQSYIEIIKTEDFMRNIIEKADLDLSASQLLNGLSFTTAGTAPILTISYSSQNPAIAEKVISTLSSEFEVGVKEIILNTYMKVIDSVKVVERVPAKAKIIIIGFIAGIVLAIGLALILDYLDDTVNRKEDMENLLPIPVLGILPIEEEEKVKKKKSHRRQKTMEAVIGG